MRQRRGSLKTIAVALLLALPVTGCALKLTPDLIASCNSQAFVTLRPLTKPIRSVRIDNEVQFGCKACHRLLRDWQLDFVEVSKEGEFVDRFRLAARGDQACRRDPFKDGFLWIYGRAPAGSCLVVERDAAAKAEALITVRSGLVPGLQVAHAWEHWLVTASDNPQPLAEVRTFARRDIHRGNVDCSKAREGFPSEPVRAMMDGVAHRRD